METAIVTETIKMNGILKTIYERRAVRKYKNKSVERELIEQILAAGRMAPSAINRQPWKFYVLTNAEMIKTFSKEIGKAAAAGLMKSGIKNIVKVAASSFHLAHGIDFLRGDDPIFHGAPVVIFITSPKDNEWASLDIGMCSQNVMLAAKSLGLDTCQVGLGKYVEHTKVFSELNVSKSENVNLAVILGYGDETPVLHERVENNIVFVN